MLFTCYSCIGTKCVVVAYQYLYSQMRVTNQCCPSKNIKIDFIFESYFLFNMGSFQNKFTLYKIRIMISTNLLNDAIDKMYAVFSVQTTHN